MAETPRPLVAGNWKMNGLRGSAAELTKIMSGAGEVAARADLMVCPPATLLATFASLVQGTPVDGRRPGLPRRAVRRLHRRPLGGDAARLPARSRSSSAIRSGGSIIAKPMPR